MLKQDITLYFTKDMQFCECIVCALLVLNVAYDKKRKEASQNAYITTGRHADRQTTK
jgi:hypothetical protein